MTFVIAANCTSDTKDILKKIISNKKFVDYSLQNKLNLHDNTILIRLALINLINNFPTNEEIQKIKISLLRPSEFDDYLEKCLEGLQ